MMLPGEHGQELGGSRMGENLRTVAMGRENQGLAVGLALWRMDQRVGVRSRRHAHDFHQITLFLTSPGALEWRFAAAKVGVERPGPGDIAICPAFVPVAPRWERPFEAVSIRVAVDHLSGIAERSGFGPEVTLQRVGFRRDPFLREIVQKLAEAREGPLTARAALADALGTTLGLHLLQEYQAPALLEAPPPARLDPATLARVQAHVEAHLAGDLAVERLADLAGLGTFDFIRRFRDATGTTPHQYVLRRRVEAARAAILAGGKIAAAASVAGFASQSHLHGHCRRLLGVTPGELAREGRLLRERLAR